MFVDLCHVGNRSYIRLRNLPPDSVIKHTLVEAGIIIGIDGPHHNAFKIRPPMPFDDDNAKELVTALDQALACIQS